MSYTIEHQVPRPKVVKENLPLSATLHAQVQKHRQELFDIFEGKDERKIMIVGPCSAWPNKAVLEYAKQLQETAKKVDDKIIVVLRVYTQKPRTTVGWTGPANQPDPFKNPNLKEGIYYCREMMLEALELGFPLADEALFTHNEGYFSDLLSWVAIGARSSEDQEHRIYASMIEHPVGIKHPTSGNLTVGINSVLAAQSPHTFLLHRQQVKTSGNPHAHLVLRGGNGEPNYGEVNKSIELLKRNNIKHPSIILDLSHENSIDPTTGKKDPLRQPIVMQELLAKGLAPELKGFMMESFIKTGNQKASEGMDLNGLSITDACLGIEETKEAILSLYKIL